jgi:hypothetical protein
MEGKEKLAVVMMGRVPQVSILRPWNQSGDLYNKGGKPQISTGVRTWEVKSN